MMGKIKIIIYLWGLLLFLDSCSVHVSSSDKENNFDISSLYGKYLDVRWAPDMKELYIFPDGRIKYIIHQDVLGTVEVEGYWEIIRDTLKLSYELPQKYEYAKIDIQYKATNEGQTIITVVDEAMESLSEGKVFIDGERHDLDMETLQTDIVLPSRYVDTIQVSHSFMETRKIKIGKKIDGVLLLRCGSDCRRSLLYEIFKEKWLITTNKLTPIVGDSLHEKSFMTKIERYQ